MSRIRRIAPGLGRGGLLGNTEGPESYLSELDTLPSQFCRATGGTETVISQGGKYYRVHTFTDTDPTSLLLNFDGANGSTTFTDDSGWGHAVTANGDAEISTTESVFGGSSAYFDGTGDYLTVPNHPAIQLTNSAAWTIECWVYASALSGDQHFLHRYDLSSPNAGYALAFGAAGGAATTLRFYDGGSWRDLQTSVSTGQWHHVAVSFEGSASTARMFFDGVQSGSAFTPSASIANTVANLGIGAQFSGSFPFNGYIDSLRITKGQALYTAAFTPPTTALTRVGSGSLTFTRGGAVEYLVVGGGGGGGGTGPAVGGSGGGGAGGFRTGTGFAVTAGTSYLITTGAGGAAGANGSTNGGTGSNSVFSSITSAGGGGGAGISGAIAGGNGGSGGGGRAGGGSGTGNTPSTSPSQGSNGGIGNNSAPNFGSGGGGGATGAGENGTATVAGNGGAGTASSISGSSVTYAGGGGGGAYAGGTAGSGGSGGGGNGRANSTTDADSGVPNTGGGGGGAGTISAVTNQLGGSGGSGIVIARYRITQAEYEAEAA